MSQVHWWHEISAAFRWGKLQSADSESDHPVLHQSTQYLMVRLQACEERGKAEGLVWNPLFPVPRGSVKLLTSVTYAMVMLVQLQRKNRELQQQEQELWARIHNLWDRLELTDDERTDFESCHKGHKHSVLSALRDEIQRCEQLKYANMQRFVEGARRELVDLWNRCYFSKEQRDAFLPYHDGRC